MERLRKFLNKIQLNKNKTIYGYIIFVVVFALLICSYYLLPQETTSVEKDNKMQNKDNSQTVASVKNNDLDKFGISMLYPTKINGVIWFSNWSLGMQRTLTSGQKDPNDNMFFARGNGKTYIDGNGIATLSGDSPRMYVYDSSHRQKWKDVEVTVYMMRVKESEAISSQGIVIGARSEHQDATLKNPCAGRAYYGRILYDGRAVFQKELIHEDAYTSNMPSEQNKIDWKTIDGTMPKDVWIGVKFIVKNTDDNRSVKLELYLDMTEGKNGGNWEKVAEYTDSGNWSEVNTKTDIFSVCGYSTNKVLVDPSSSIFIRNDKIKEAKYKWFSIREIK